MHTSVVCTGLGQVSCAALNIEGYWKHLKKGGRGAFQYKEFGSNNLPILTASVSRELNSELSQRQTRRIDRFTTLAFTSVSQALSMSRLSMQSIVRDDVGIFVGNATGGWGYVEPQLYSLYGEGNLQSISPYVATAWFPTSAQGVVSIYSGVGGLSKTFSAENLSFAFALRNAMWAIISGKLNTAIVVGCEAPLTPLVYNACKRKGYAASDGIYCPYHYDAHGGILGEGAAAIVLESRTNAQMRNVKEIAEFELPQVGNSHESVIMNALEGDFSSVDYVSRLLTQVSDAAQA